MVRPVAVNLPARREPAGVPPPGDPAIARLEARRRTSAAGRDPLRINVASESDWWRWILAALAIVWLAEPWLALGSKREIAQPETMS